MAWQQFHWQRGTVACLRKGLGDPIVLIHNIYPGADHHEFDRNIDILARNYSVYAIDLLGFGQSDAPRLKYRASTYIQLIHDFLDQVVQQPAIVVSAGLSCAFVAAVAAKHPQLFAGIVMICPRSEPTGMDSPRWFAPLKHLFLTTPASQSSFYGSLAGQAQLSKFLYNCFYNGKNVTPEKIQRLTDNTLRPGTLYPYASLITGYLDEPLLDHLPRITSPILLIWGNHARPTPVQHAVRLVALSQKIDLQIIDNAGAWPHDEQSSRVNQLMADFASSRFLALESKPGPPAPPADPSTTSAPSTSSSSSPPAPAPHSG